MLLVKMTATLLSVRVMTNINRTQLFVCILLFENAGEENHKLKIYNYAFFVCTNLVASIKVNPAGYWTDLV